MRYKLVKQIHDFGCGIACVASLLGIKYSDAILLFENGKKRAATMPNFYCKEIVSILNSTGISAEYKYLKPRIRSRIYNPGTIVYIGKSTRYRFGHYLLRTETSWMDPWHNMSKDKCVTNAFAGFRRRLPGRPIYAIFNNVNK